MVRHITSFSWGRVRPAGHRPQVPGLSEFTDRPPWTCRSARRYPAGGSSSGTSVQQQQTPAPGERPEQHRGGRQPQKAYDMPPPTSLVDRDVVRLRQRNEQLHATTGRAADALRDALARKPGWEDRAVKALGELRLVLSGQHPDPDVRSIDRHSRTTSALARITGGRR